MATFPWHERPLWSGGLGEPIVSSVNRQWWDDPAYATVRTVYSILGTVGGIAGAYHGYKRNDSVGWAIGWFFFGSIIPVLALPIMFAQGFAERKR